MDFIEKCKGWVVSLWHLFRPLPVIKPLPILYIRFVTPEDVYQLDPLWNYHGELWWSKDKLYCPRCGHNTYLPVQMTSDMDLSQAFRPGPIQPYRPYLIALFEPEPLWTIAGDFGEIQVYDISETARYCECLGDGAHDTSEDEDDDGCYCPPGQN